MAKLKIAKELFDLFFPVGYIYTSMNSTDPKTLFGYGEWTQIVDEFLYCTNSSKVVAGSNSVSYTPSGSVGSHALTTSELPAHTHGSKTLNGTFEIRRIKNGTDLIVGATTGITGIVSRSAATWSGSHTVAGNGGTESKPTTDVVRINATHEHTSVGSNAGHTHTFTGTSATISINPKHITCYAWYRTA